MKPLVYNNKLKDDFLNYYRILSEPVSFPPMNVHNILKKNNTVYVVEKTRILFL